ncbi:hypothetical protein V2I01_38890 [Micromonospora sp. BRA006-A]|nr:hypothetical protein [Micromonospora sp. BRA006-A]
MMTFLPDPTGPAGPVPASCGADPPACCSPPPSRPSVSARAATTARRPPLGRRRRPRRHRPRRHPYPSPTPPPDQDGDGIPDSSDTYPHDPKNIPQQEPFVLTCYLTDGFDEHRTFTIITGKDGRPDFSEAWAAKPCPATPTRRSVRSARSR